MKLIFEEYTKSFRKNGTLSKKFLPPILSRKKIVVFLEAAQFIVTNSERQYAHQYCKNVQHRRMCVLVSSILR